MSKPILSPEDGASLYLNESGPRSPVSPRKSMSKKMPKPLARRIKEQRFYCYVLDVRRVPASEGVFFLPIDLPFVATYLACVSTFPAKMQIEIGRRTIFAGPVPQRPVPLLTPLRIRRGSVLTIKLGNELRTRRWNRFQLCLNGQITIERQA